MVTIKGKVFDVGMLDNGRGIKVESSGEVVEINGLTEDECKKVAQHLDEHIEITIATLKAMTPTELILIESLKDDIARLRTQRDYLLAESDEQYTVSTVMLTRDQFERMPEFNGF